MASPSFLFLKEASLRAFEALPFVMRRLSLYFAFYALPLSFICVFWIYSSVEAEYLQWARQRLPVVFLFLNMAFAVFITCYWAKVSEDRSYKEGFWDFIRETVTPFVIANVKKYLVILSWGIPLGISAFYFVFVWKGLPGLFGAEVNISYKGPILFALLFASAGFGALVLIQVIRLSFVTQAVFFDPQCRSKALPPLKASRQLVRGRFFSVLLYLAVLFAAYLALSSTARGLCYGMASLLGDSAVSAAATDSLILTFDFYLQNISLLFVTCLYFAASSRKQSA